MGPMEVWSYSELLPSIQQSRNRLGAKDNSAGQKRVELVEGQEEFGKRLPVRGTSLERYYNRCNFFWMGCALQFHVETREVAPEESRLHSNLRELNAISSAILESLPSPTHDTQIPAEGLDRRQKSNCQNPDMASKAMVSSLNHDESGTAFASSNNE
ncbi:Hypothetical predicted protein [Pelobates cultripes]|uniref:Uncharacterized protein n=1 Tax=Pelobates cultripes TaxID=61616 RepID=A0AAD1T0W9_PELCU|nr:Hypothetical predicted protein [Pelobates cultripes]